MNPTRVFVSKAAINAISSLINVPFLRRVGYYLVDKKIQEKLLKEQQKGVLPRMILDQGQMIRNMIKAFDRWVGNKNVKRTSVKKLMRSFLNMGSKENKTIMENFERQFGFSTPRFITLSPTKRCNLECIGCYASSDAESFNHLDYDTINRIVREQKNLWGSHFTVISGGEPLVYKSQGKDILDLVEENPDTFFLMYTNGTLIDKKTAERMGEQANITPSVSVEGLEEETDWRRGKGTHKKILRAFDNLREAGVLYGISITVTTENAELVFSPEFIDYYFGQQGVYYAWIFQYMPIGRSYDLKLMATPEQRVGMFRKMNYWVYEKELFIADFWNSGTACNGCLSAGRKGGYIYIDWNGNVMPCVFNPYTSHNIKEVYASGGDLNDVLLSPLMKKIRDWQNGYYDHGNNGNERGNMLAPCPIRDHHGELRAILEETGAKPADESAETALEDREYYEGMVKYGREVEEMTKLIWEKEYLGIEEKTLKEAKSR